MDLAFAGQMFKALGDDSRLRVLNLIVQFNEMCISDLELVLEYSQTKTSRHLIYLKNSGILAIRKKGQWTFYFLKPTVRDLISDYFKTLFADTTLLKDIDTYKILYSNRELAAYKMTQRRYY